MARDIRELVDRLTLDEKAALTAGADLWSTVAVPRAGIPAVTVTDGPNGARGSALFGLGTQTAVCIPCGSAIGATWDPELALRLGVMVGEEARTKACRVLLAPTVNLHRSPLAGRNFECMSEDPLLSGKIAAAYVRGVQSQGVVTTVKHFAGNDSEFERNTIDSVIDARTLREITLVPFELAVREGGALGVMTAYNRLNGVHCSEHRELLAGILRGEWGFDGFVVTDWFSAGSTIGSATAGVDLEMPGPGRFLGRALAAAVRAGDLDEAIVDAQVTRLLEVLDRIGALDDAPGVPETSVDRPEHRALAREAAVAATVLLQNDGVLPFDAGATRTIAVIGPNAARTEIMGGGSAALAPHYRVSVLEGVRARVGDTVQIVHERGCDIDRTTPPLQTSQLTRPDGTPGMTAELYAGTSFAGKVVAEARFADGRAMFAGVPASGLAVDDFSMRIRTRFTPTETGVHTFTLVQAGGSARVTADGALLLDGVSAPPGAGSELFGMASAEVVAGVTLTAGKCVDLVVEFAAGPGLLVRGVKIGCRLPSPPDLLEHAVAAAAAADAALVVVGTNGDWETEGHDRASIDLPGRQDELVNRVLAVNPNTVVVVNTGAPVAMPWAGDAPAVIQAWFAGQEAGHALAAVVFGDADPGGRLPTTLPIRLEHNPSFGNFPGENGQVRYGEGLLTGYRWYDARHLAVRFPFGHGDSYTTFAIGTPAISAAVVAPGEPVTLTVPVTNTGGRKGTEVVQCYVAPRAPRLTRPPKELKAFAKVTLEPGAAATVTLVLDARAFAYWDPGDPHFAAASASASRAVPAGSAEAHRTQPGWYADPGEYDLWIGRSSADLAHRVTITLDGARAS